VLAAVPVMALVYGEPSLLAPGLVVSLAVIGAALQTPIWPYYRSMDFLRQRLLQAVDPLVSLVLTVGLAAAGLGYWALVIGVVAGDVRRCGGRGVELPVRLRLRWTPGALRAYASFSWPLLAAERVGGGHRAVRRRSSRSSSSAWPASARSRWRRRSSPTPAASTRSSRRRCTPPSAGSSTAATRSPRCS
jgi:hypothetical protein